MPAGTGTTKAAHQPVERCFHRYREPYTYKDATDSSLTVCSVNTDDLIGEICNEFPKEKII